MGRWIDNNQKIKNYADRWASETRSWKSIKGFFRERTLQSEKPTIELVMVFKADAELNLHSRYERKRIRGEWFALSSDDLIDIHNDYKNNLL